MKSENYETGLSDYHKRYIHFWGKPLPKENLKQVTIGALKTLNGTSLMKNWKKEFQLISALKHFLKS